MLSTGYGADIAASGRMYPLSSVRETLVVPGLGACIASLVEEIVCEAVETSERCGESVGLDMVDSGVGGEFKHCPVMMLDDTILPVAVGKPTPGYLSDLTEYTESEMSEVSVVCQG